VGKSFPEQKKLQSGATLKEGSGSQKLGVNPWLANTFSPRLGQSGVNLASSLDRIPRG